VDLAKENY